MGLHARALDCTSTIGLYKYVQSCLSMHKSIWEKAMAACGAVLMCVLLLLTLTIGTSGKQLTTVTVYSLVPANNDSIKK